MTFNKFSKKNSKQFILFLTVILKCENLNLFLYHLKKSIEIKKVIYIYTFYQ
jgi:hypothetical protein